MSDINIEDIIIESDNIEEVWEYLSEKPVIVSKIFYLYYYLDFTILEISKSLKMNESNVKNYLYRTLKEMNKAFREESD